MSWSFENVENNKEVILLSENIQRDKIILYLLNYLYNNSQNLISQYNIYIYCVYQAVGNIGLDYLLNLNIEKFN